MSSISDVIKSFPNDLQDPVFHFWEALKEELGVKREDFTELKKIVQDLAQAQNRTELRLEELAQAQSRTEIRLEELAQAQSRTELRLEELAQAQKELAEAQKDTDRSIKRLSDTVDFKIGGLGRRWGIDSEKSFRNGLTEILADTGYTVQNFIESDTKGIVFGRPAEIEIDVIIKGERTIVVEIKSSVSKSDVFIFLKKVDFYRQISGKQVDSTLMITPYIDDAARDIAHQYDIIVCDTLSDIEPSIQKA